MVTTILCLVTVVISMIAFNRVELFEQFKHFPFIEYRNKEYWRWLTSGFLHLDFTHLAFNMLALYTFGQGVEREFVSYFGQSQGQLIYLFFYLFTIIIADIPTFLQQRNNRNYGAIGASGGVSGIIFAAILFNPWLQLLVFFLPMRGIFFGILYLVYSSWAANNAKDNIGHSAHFTGAIVGFLGTALIMPGKLQEFFLMLQYNSPF
jgi:membrane associated rhomboid family serine protease